MARKLSAQNETPTIGHNSGADDEANRVQFLSILSQYDTALADVEAARAPLKVAQKKVSAIVGLAKAAGVPKWRLEQRHAEMNRTSSENAENIAAERRERRWAGVIPPQQQELPQQESPEEVRDEMFWQLDGYRAGVLGRAAQLPEGIPTRFTQPWMGGHADGRKSYLLTLAKDVPKPKGAKAKDIAKDAEEQLDVEAAANKLAASEFMKTSGEKPLALLKAMLVKEPDHIGLAETIAEREAAGETADPAEVQAFVDEIVQPPEDEGFEATEEELAAQKLRPSVQAAEGDEGPVV